MHGAVDNLLGNLLLQQGISTYFLSKSPLNAASNYLLALAAVLFVIWPKSQYLHIGSPPLTFSIEIIAATIIVAYFSFSYGAGRLGDETAPFAPRALIGAKLSPQRAKVGLLVLTSAHTLFFILLALPLLVAAAHVSGIAARTFGRAIGLMMICALAYRWLGLLTMCVWEQQDFLRYVVIRVAFVGLVLGSAFFLPCLNPLLGLISMSFGEELGQVVVVFGYHLSYATVALIIHLLLLLSAYIMVAKLLKNQPSGSTDADLLTGEPPRG